MKLENEMCKDPKITIRNTADHESGRRNATQKSSGLYFCASRERVRMLLMVLDSVKIFIVFLMLQSYSFLCLGALVLYSHSQTENEFGGPPCEVPLITFPVSTCII